MYKKIMLTLCVFVPVAGHLSANVDYNHRRDSTATNDKNSDQQIQMQIKDALKDGWFSSGYKNVTFTVNNGVVTLTGFVQERDSIKDIENRVKNIDSVKVVKNQLVVRAENQQERNFNKQDSGYYDQNRANPNENRNHEQRDMNMDMNRQHSFDSNNPQHNAFASDAEIKQAVQSELTNNWWGNYRDIRVEVKDGVVVLKGTVPSANDVADIEDRLGDVQGVRTIRTELQIQRR